MNTPLRILEALLASMCLLGSASFNSAAEFVVNSELDLPDARPGDGVSDVGGGISTLRSAIEEANALPGADTIVFDIDPGGPVTIAIAEPLPTILDPVTVDGTTGMFLVQFFASREADSTGFGEGEQYLGSQWVITDINGDAAFKAKFKVSKGTGRVITVTATDLQRNTSEFSPTVMVASPR